jgi:capsule polysaccharide export protein KpsC/LpsZ
MKPGDVIELLVTDEKSPNYEQNRRYFFAIHFWAKEHCKSYLDFHIQDVSDVSLQWDEIACYKMTDEADATLFRLKWL